MVRNHSIIASALLLTSVVAGQLPHNPVPTRIETEVYGAHDGAVLAIDCYLGGPGKAQIRVQGGQPGAMAQILVANRRYKSRLFTDGLFLVHPSAVPVTGTFDGEGEFSFPIDLDNTAYCGKSAFFQGVQVKTSHNLFELSPGLRVTFHDGNIQPDLNYPEAPLTAIYCKTIASEATHGVRVRVADPGPGYELAVERYATFDDGRTVVYLSLTADSVPETLPPSARGDGARMTYFVDFGEFVTPFIEVVVSPKWIVNVPKDYWRAAWIETELPPRPGNWPHDGEAPVVDKPLVDKLVDKIVSDA